MSREFPSPLKAVRAKCLECCLDQSNEVSLCGAATCPIYFLRFGKSVPGIRPLTAIVEKCRDCAGDEQPAACKMKTCALHPFRLGKNPNRAGMGMKGGNPANLQKKPRTQDVIQERTAPCAGLCSCSTRCAECTCLNGGLK